MPLAALALARAHWKLIGLGLLCLALAVQTVRLGHAENKADKLRINLNEARAELKAISSARNEQRETTEGNIRESQKHIQIRDKVAERIEKAPLPGNCVTPPEILGADI